MAMGTAMDMAMVIQSLKKIVMVMVTVMAIQSLKKIVMAMDTAMAYLCKRIEMMLKLEVCTIMCLILLGPRPFLSSKFIFDWFQFSGMDNIAFSDHGLFLLDG